MEHTIAEPTMVRCPYCGKQDHGTLEVETNTGLPHPRVTIRLPLDWTWSGDGRESAQIICRDCVIAWGNCKAVPVDVAKLRAELAALHKRHEEAALGWAESRVALNRAEQRIADLEADMWHESRRRDV